MLSVFHVYYSKYFVLLYDTYKILLSLLCLFQNVVPSVKSTKICTLFAWYKSKFIYNVARTHIHVSRNQNNLHVQTSNFDWGVRFWFLPLLQLLGITEWNSEILLPLVSAVNLVLISNATNHDLITPSFETNICTIKNCVLIYFITATMGFLLVIAQLWVFLKEVKINKGYILYRMPIN